MPEEMSIAAATREPFTDKQGQYSHLQNCRSSNECRCDPT